MGFAFSETFPATYVQTLGEVNLLLRLRKGRALSKPSQGLVYYASRTACTRARIRHCVVRCVYLISYLYTVYDIVCLFRRVRIATASRTA